MKFRWSQLLPLLIGTLGISLLIFVIWPSIVRLAIYQIHSYSLRNLPILVDVAKVGFGLSPLSIQLSGISTQILDQTQLKAIEKLDISEIQLIFDWSEFIRGRIDISQVQINSVQSQINLDPLLDPSSQSTPPLLLSPLYLLIKQLPIRSVLINDASLTLLSKNKNFSTQLNTQRLALATRTKDVVLDGDIQVNDTSLYEVKTDLDSSIHISCALNSDELLCEELSFSSKFFSAQIAATFPGDSDLKTHWGKGSIQANSNLEEAEKFFEPLRKHFRIPKLQGEIKTNLTFDTTLDTAIEKNLVGQVLGNSLNLNGYEIGEIDANIKLTQESLEIKNAQLTHSTGSAIINDFTLQLIHPYSIESKVQLLNAQLQNLLKSLHLYSVPVYLGVNGKLQCAGNLADPTLHCQGSAEGDNLEVNSEMHSNSTQTTHNIVTLDAFKANGEFRIGPKRVEYNATVDLHGNKGASTGFIDYATGFNITFESDKLNFANIKNLANLKLEGESSVKGQTTGNSSGAIFSMDLDANSAWFEKYHLGSFQTRLSYKTGNLSFSKIKGIVLESNYNGELNVDLFSKTIGASFESPVLDLANLQFVLSRIVKLPFQISGKGKATAVVHGPLDFSHLSYTLDAQANNLEIANEHFNNLSLKLNSKEGEVRTEKVELAKGNSILSLKGGAHPNGRVEAKVKGIGIHLEEIRLVEKINSAITGLLDLEVEINGHILSPEVGIKSQIHDVVIEEEQIRDSFANFTISQTKIEGEAKLFGSQLETKIIWPFDKNSEFKLWTKAQNWNYATLIGLIGGGTIRDEYMASISGVVDLSSQTGGLSKANGFVKIGKFYLKRGLQSLSNSKPIEVVFRDGQIDILQWVLVGEETQFKLEGKNFNLKNLDFTLNGQAELTLLHLFAPFLEDLGGKAEISVAVKGDVLKPEILGSARTKEAYIRVPGLPHPFEKVNSEISFSHTRAIINNAKAQFAGGTINLEGQLEIMGVRDIATNVTASVQGVKLNIPDHILTQGNADLTITGNWFPFTLSGSYHVMGGLVDKEFGDETVEATTKQSIYLPKQLIEASFQPLLLDIQVIMQKNLRMKNSQIDGYLTGALHINGSPSKPSLRGDIKTIPGTKILFRDKVFNIQTGDIQFNTPNEINPDLFVNAQSRVKNYDVTLLVQGSAKKPVIRMSSQPPLPENDIVSLLALGITSSKLADKVDSDQQAVQSSYQIGSAILSQNPLNREFKDRFGVELQFSSAFDDTKNIAIPKFTINKQLTQKVLLSGSRSLGNQLVQDMRLQYQINPEVSAVLFGESRETDNASQISNQKTDSPGNTGIMGLDLEYKVDFK